MNKKGHRKEDWTNISVSLPIKTLQEIDRLAEEDNRNRSNWIVNELTLAIQARERKENRLPAAFPQQVPARYSPSAPPMTRAAETPPKAALKKSTTPQDVIKPES